MRRWRCCSRVPTRVRRSCWRAARALSSSQPSCALHGLGQNRRIGQHLPDVGPDRRVEVGRRDGVGLAACGSPRAISRALCRAAVVGRAVVVAATLGGPAAAATDQAAQEVVPARAARGPALIAREVLLRRREALRGDDRRHGHADPRRRRAGAGGHLAGPPRRACAERVAPLRRRAAPDCRRQRRDNARCAGSPGRWRGPRAPARSPSGCR